MYAMALFMISSNRYLPQGVTPMLEGTLHYPKAFPQLSSPSYIVRMVEYLTYSLHLHLPRAADGVVCANNEGEGKYLIIALLILEASKWYK